MQLQHDRAQDAIVSASTDDPEQRTADGVLFFIVGCDTMAPAAAASAAFFKAEEDQNADEAMIAIEYARYGGPEVLETVEREERQPGPGEIQVRLHAASVAPIDWKLRAGLLQNFFQLEFPRIPGRDGAGIVSALGEGVTGFEIGDRVCVMAGHHAPGTYAQSVTCEAEHALAAPGMLKFNAAASLVNAGLSAWIAAVEVADLRPGMNVLVHGGSGAVGGILVQLARHLGADVAATCRAANRDYVLSLGAHRAIAYDEEDFAELRGQDVVFDLIGGEVHDRSYRVLRPTGHLVYFVAAPIAERGAEFGVRVSRAMVADRRDPVANILDLAARGVIRPQMAACMPLQEAARAHRLMQAGEITRGRLILEVP